jgi:hypothetical protein
MTADNSTDRAARSKPAKPYPAFPLTAHPAGYWCKKIRGKTHYFSPWEDPDGAYRQTISDKRLRAVADHVHAWLFPPAKKAATDHAKKDEEERRRRRSPCP